MLSSRLAVAMAAALVALSGMAAPGDADRGPAPSPAETIGPTPKLGPVDKHLITTVQIAPAKGWTSGSKPSAAQGIAVNAFARGLNHPRWIYVLPSGDVLPGVSCHANCMPLSIGANDLRHTTSESTHQPPSRTRVRHESGEAACLQVDSCRAVTSQAGIVAHPRPPEIHW